jgi:hypothetical protein
VVSGFRVDPTQGSRRILGKEVVSAEHPHQGRHRCPGLWSQLGEPVRDEMVSRGILQDADQECHCMSGVIREAAKGLGGGHADSDILLGKDSLQRRHGGPSGAAHPAERLGGRLTDG